MGQIAIKDWINLNKKNAIASISIVNNSARNTVIDANYNVYATGFYQGSDDRIKDYLGEYNVQLEDVMKIPIWRYTLKSGESRIVRNKIGG